MLRNTHLCVALLVVCGAAAASAADAGRKLKQVTVFYDTPAAAGSTSVGLNGGLGVGPDGTVHAAAGASTTSSSAVSNPLLNILTRGAYKNRPKAASSAYTQIPLLQQPSIFPTLSYGLAEGKGDALSTSNGGWGNAEFGYNPINNNLGASVSGGTSQSANLGASERVGEVNPDAGFSGVEFAGYSNDLTNAADSRTDQSAQVIAYPYNILSPVNPLTCTQALLYAATFTQYDLGAPVSSLPREKPPSVVPFCLSLFNFGTLDDFANFINNGSRNANGEEEGNRNGTGIAQFFDRGDGHIPAIDANPALAARLLNATGSSAVFQRPSVGNSSTAPGNTNITVLSGNTNGSVVVLPNASLAQPLPASPQNPPKTDGDARATAGQQGSGATAPAARGAGQQQRGKLVSFSEALNAAVKQSPAAVQALFASGPGKALMDRLNTGVLAEAADGTTKLAASQGSRVIERLSDPLASLNKALGNMTTALAAGVGQVGLKAVVAAVETAEPLLAARAGLNKALSPIAQKSRDAATKAADAAKAKAAEAIAALPARGDKQAVLDTFTKINAPKGSVGDKVPSMSSKAAQMG